MAHLFVSPTAQYELSVKLARLVFKSGFAPDCIIGVLRGGAVPGLVMHEMLKLEGMDIPFDFVTAKSYNGMNQDKGVEVRGLTEVVVKGKSILLVDDLWDTGRTICELASKLTKMGARDVVVATLYFKPTKNQYAPAIPNHFVSELAADVWVVFPHELTDIPKDALKGHPLFGCFNKSDV